MTQQEIIAQKELLESKIAAGCFPASIVKEIEKRIIVLDEMLTN